MFGKLLKHELRTGLRTFIPVWAGMLLLSVLTGITVRLTDFREGSFIAGFAFVMLIMLSVALVIATIVLTIVYIIRRFASGLLGNEGYLMFTLPVTTGQLLGSRVLTAFLYELFSILVGCISGLAILLIADTHATLSFIEQIFPALGYVIQREGISVLLLVELVIILCVTLCEAFMRIQLCISIGHLFRRGRAGFSILMYVAISWLLEIIWLVLMMSSDVQRFMEQLIRVQNTETVAVVLGILAGLIALVCVGYYLIMHLILRKKLNLT